MNKRLDLAGRRFGDWVVLSFSHKGRHGEIYWLCEDVVSGERRAVRSRNLTSGRSKSSGRRHKQAVTTHGMTGTPTFKSWESMKQRCLNPNAPDYSRYGGLGIQVHGPWVHSFEQFLKDMGRRPKGKTLDRRDVFGDYKPGNCRWATPRQQQRNKRLTRLIAFQDRKMSVGDWADEVGLTSKIINWRLDNGWSVGKALTTPIIEGRGKKRL